MGRRLTNMVLLILCSASLLVSNPSSITADATEMCGPQQYYDKQRKVCLDLCGRYGATRCPIERFCSTRVSWGDRINPSRCLPHCFHHCDGNQYCDHETHDCLPCDSLCSRPNITQCCKYCYDVYAMLTTTSHDATTSQVITTSQNTTAHYDITTHATPWEADQSAWISRPLQHVTWKAIAVMFICFTVILVIGFVGGTLVVVKYNRLQSVPTIVADCEADTSLLPAQKQVECVIPSTDITHKCRSV